MERPHRPDGHAAVGADAGALQGGRDGPRLARLPHQGGSFRGDRRSHQAAGAALRISRSGRAHRAGDALRGARPAVALTLTTLTLTALTLTTLTVTTLT